MRQLEVIEVNSKVLKNIMWCHNSDRMMIKFIDSPIYIYPDVPKYIFDKFVKAESKGKFFLSIIKKQYPKFLRLDN